MILVTLGPRAPSFPTVSPATFVGGSHSTVHGCASSANFFTSEKANRVSHNFLFPPRARGLPLPSVFVFVFAFLLMEGRKTWRWLEKENSLIRSRETSESYTGLNLPFDLACLHHAFEKLEYILSIWKIIRGKFNTGTPYYSYVLCSFLHGTCPGVI